MYIFKLYIFSNIPLSGFTMVSRSNIGKIIISKNKTYRLHQIFWFDIAQTSHAFPPFAC